MPNRPRENNTNNLMATIIMKLNKAGAKTTTRNETHKHDRGMTPTKNTEKNNNNKTNNENKKKEKLIRTRRII